MFKQIRKIVSLVILAAFGATSIYSPAYAQFVDPMPRMPAPGTMVHLSPEYTPAYLKGIVIHPENALKFDFIVYKGDTFLTDAQKRVEYTKLTKYFLASLAIPDDDQWVNLSPYEKDRIIKDDFGKTEMGRDLLSQDYMLKQITASLIYPEDNLGKKFWDRVYAQAQEQFGTSNIPVNTFNKVWILPDDALIYEKGNAAYVLKNHLRVMLEEDYLSLQKHSGISSSSVILSAAKDPNRINTLGSKIVRQIVLPELEREVNEDKNFAALRQVYSGMLLAAWYKRALKESLLSKIYANKSKVKGIDQDPKTNEQIYRQYLRAYKKGVFNYIKEDVDKYTNEVIPRKYFSGGAVSYAMASRYVKDPVHEIFSMDAAERINFAENENNLDYAQVAAEEQSVVNRLAGQTPSSNSNAAMTQPVKENQKVMILYTDGARDFLTFRNMGGSLYYQMNAGNFKPFINGQIIERHKTNLRFLMSIAGTFSIDDIGPHNPWFQVQIPRSWSITTNEAIILKDGQGRNKYLILLLDLGEGSFLVSDDGRRNTFFYNTVYQGPGATQFKIIKTGDAFTIENVRVDEQFTLTSPSQAMTAPRKDHAVLVPKKDRSTQGVPNKWTGEMYQIENDHKEGLRWGFIPQTFKIGDKVKVAQGHQIWTIQKINLTRVKELSRPLTIAPAYQVILVNDEGGNEQVVDVNSQTVSEILTKVRITDDTADSQETGELKEIKFTSLAAASLYDLLQDFAAEYGSLSMAKKQVQLHNQLLETIENLRILRSWVTTVKSEVLKDRDRFQDRFESKLPALPTFHFQGKNNRRKKVLEELAIRIANLVRTSDGSPNKIDLKGMEISILVHEWTQQKIVKMIEKWINSWITAHQPQSPESSPAMMTRQVLHVFKRSKATDALQDLGGIDFNSANLHLQIKRDGKGIPLPISQQDMENIHIDGLIPVVLEIKAAVDTPLMSELQINH